MNDPQFQQFLPAYQQQMQQLSSQVYLLQQHIVALQAESAVKAEGRQPRRTIEFTSQFGEDRLAWALLSHKTTGFFIEAGAFDGYHYSTTYGMEAMGWNGLLVEAIPARFRQCAERRLNSKVVNAALAPDGASGDAEFWVMQDEMNSYSMGPGREQSGAAAPREKVTVPRMSLNQLLADHQGPVDFVSLDVEGDEVSALRGFDLARFRPSVMIIEDNSGNNFELAAFMQANSYRRSARLAVNDVYIRSDEKEMIEIMNWISVRGF